MSADKNIHLPVYTATNKTSSQATFSLDWPILIGRQPSLDWACLSQIGSEISHLDPAWIIPIVCALVSLYPR